jgi:hypothetical protein
MKSQSLNNCFHRLSSGLIKVRVEDTVFTLMPPSLELLLDADEEYNRVFDKGLFDNFMSEDEVLSLLLEKGIWGDDGENSLKTLEQEIDNQKHSMYKDFTQFNFQGVSSGRKRLQKLNQKLIEQLTKRHQFDHLLLENYAASMREQYIISRSIRGVQQDALHFSLLLKIVSEYSKLALTLTELRTIARIDPWRTHWSLFNFRIFKNFPLSEEQKAVASFSQLYDNIYKHPEPPAEEIISDDDLLDGWIIDCRQKNKKQQPKTTNKNSKIGQHSEVFAIAKNKKEAEKIYDKNSEAGRRIIKSRQKIAGTVNETQLPDKKTELQILATERSKNVKRK